MKNQRTLTFKRLIFIMILPLVVGLLAACDNTQPIAEVPTVLIVNPLGAALQPFADSFILGLGEAGFSDGENVRYVYGTPPESPAPPAIAAALTADLTTHSPDLIVCISTGACTAAQALTAESGTPVLFMAVTDPIGAGLVTDFAETDRITGISSAPRNAANEGRAFEWLIQVAPSITRVLIPHNPDDQVAALRVRVALATADQMNVEVIVYPVSSEEETFALLENFPDDVSAVITYSERIFSVPFMLALNELLIERQLPHLSFSNQYGQMMSYAPATDAIGRQAAVLGARILNGTPVNDLPVEVPEFNLNLNLPTIEAMGLEIDEQILRQAVIIRGEGQN